MKNYTPHLVLFEPEIPPNTGSTARLCAATETELHLIEPLGFSLDDRYLKRAGLDYWPHVKLFVWPNFNEYLEKAGKDRRLIASSSHGNTPLHKFTFTRNDSIILGPETRGLPPEIINCTEKTIRIPIWGNVRSLNLATAAGILLYQSLSSTGILDAIES